MSTSILMDPVQKAREDKHRLENEARKTELDNLEASITQDAKIPDKFRGKSLVDVVESYTNVERELTKTKQELAQQKSIVDQFAQLEPKVTTQEERKPVKADDLFENPEEAISQVIENNPVVQKLKSNADVLERSLQVNDFAKKHPTYQEDLANPEFVDWIKESSLRTRLAQAADQYNLEAGDELWQLWGEYKSIRTSATETRKQDKKEQLERALVEGTLESGSGTSVETSKIFSRAEIIDLKTRAAQGDHKAKVIVNDPVWRAAVNQAYAEKRVQ